MKYKEWMFRLSLVLNMLVFFPLFYIVVNIFWHNRSLRPTTEWRAEAVTHAGKPISVEPYKVLGRDVLFLYVKEAHYTPFGEWYPRWFVVDFSDKADDVNVFVGPLMSSLMNQHLAFKERYGVNILDGEIRELWHLSYTGNSVVFSNRVFSVSATRKKPNHKTVEVHKNTWEAVVANPPPPRSLALSERKVTGFKLTLFDPHLAEDGWAVFINVPFWDTPDTNIAPQTASVVLTNTNDVRATVSRTIYAESWVGVNFYAERVRTAQMDRHYIGTPTRWLHAERLRAAEWINWREEKEPKLTIEKFILEDPQRYLHRSNNP